MLSTHGESPTTQISGRIHPASSCLPQWRSWPANAAFRLLNSVAALSPTRRAGTAFATSGWLSGGIDRRERRAGFLSWRDSPVAAACAAGAAETDIRLAVATTSIKQERPVISHRAFSFDAIQTVY